jgi:hypothetical protein
MKSHIAPRQCAGARPADGVIKLQLKSGIKSVTFSSATVSILAGFLHRRGGASVVSINKVARVTGLIWGEV